MSDPKTEQAPPVTSPASDLDGNDSDLIAALMQPRKAADTSAKAAEELQSDADPEKAEAEAKADTDDAKDEAEPDDKGGGKDDESDEHDWKKVVQREQMKRANLEKELKGEFGKITAQLEALLAKANSPDQQQAPVTTEARVATLSEKLAAIKAAAQDGAAKGNFAEPEQLIALAEAVESELAELKAAKANPAKAELDPNSRQALAEIHYERWKTSFAKENAGIDADTFYKEWDAAVQSVGIDDLPAEKQARISKAFYESTLERFKSKPAKPVTAQFKVAANGKPAGAGEQSLIHKRNPAAVTQQATTDLNDYEIDRKLVSRIFSRE